MLENGKFLIMVKHINPYKLFHGSFIPEWLMTTDVVSANAKIIYARLCRYAGTDGKAYPKLEQLAEQVGMPVTTMRRALKELIDNQMIETNRRGLGLANDYYFLWHPLMDNQECSKMDIPECPPVDNQECPHVDTPISRESVQESHTNNITPYPLKTRFDDFWNEWPSHKRKTDKAKCKKKWETEKLEKHADEIILSVQAWKHSENWNDEGGEFIPLPFTWLHNKRWEEKPKLSEKALQRSNLIQVNYDEIEF